MFLRLCGPPSIPLSFDRCNRYTYSSLGVQAEGILASTDDFGVNVGLGLGGLITAGLLHVSGYIPNHAQNTATISMINLNFVWLPMLLYVVMFIILLFL